MKFFKKIFIFSLLLSFLLTTKTNADWNQSIGFKSLLSEYHATDYRSSVNNVGVIYTLGFPEYFDLKLAANKTLMHFEVFDEIDQDEIYASLDTHFWPSFTDGRLSLRFDMYDVSHDEAFFNTQEVDVIAAQMSYLTKRKHQYADIGYARSEYPNNLVIKQITPTIAYAFNSKINWVQFRYYIISSSNSAFSYGEDETKSLEAMLTRFFNTKENWKFDRIFISATTGEKIFAVDMDEATVANILDIQKSSAYVGGVLNIENDWKLNMRVGFNKYRNQSRNDNYSSYYVQFGFNKSW